MSETKAYRVGDFCRAYGVSRSFAYQQMKLGVLEFVQVGRMRLIPVEAAEQWFRRQADVA